MSVHVAEVEWELEGDFRLGRYSRAHRILFDGGAEMPGSASLSVVPSPYAVEAAVDPEEMFAASVSACHMLWFLHKAREASFVVQRYLDKAEATLGEDEAGRLSITRLVLRPRVRFAEPAPSLERVRALHQEAHDACFIANSIKTAVQIDIGP